MKSSLQVHQEVAQRKRLVITSYRSKADANRTMSDRLADILTAKFGTVRFLSLNALWFAVWIPLNMGLVPGITPFDPFPFGLLTMIVSLEAIFLAIIVLISQNRAARIAEVREEAALQIDSIAEGEITKVLQLLSLLLEKEGISLKNDPELASMARPVSSEEIEKALESQLS